MTAVVFAALIAKILDFVRLLANIRMNVSSVVTQLLAWLAGVLVVLVGSHAAITKGIVLPGTDAALGTLDFGSCILVGMLVSSLASFGVDLKQSFDRSDSAAKPALLTPPSPVPVVPPAPAG